LANRLPVPQIGIDDFSFRRGRRFGTIVVDLQTRKVLDVLLDRTADTSAAWMAEHLEIELVSRDRGGDYAAAARKAVPEATQTADRFHQDQRLRAKGPAPKLTDSEVITMEVVGSYLGLSQDKKLFDYFQQHYPHFFPALGSLHRTTFVRQAANLWVIEERLWCWLRDEVISHDPCKPRQMILDVSG